MSTPAERRRDELRGLLRQPAFVNFASRLFREARMLEPSRSADGGASLWSEGRRSLGLEVFRELRAADPRAAALLLVEPTSPPRETEDDRHDD